MKTLITLTGQSCSGKSTILSELVNSGLASSIVSTTSRKPRDGEKEGEHYYFISHDKSIQLENESKFAELVIYNDTRYGVTFEEFHSKMNGSLIPIIIVEPNGVRQYKHLTEEYGYKLISVYLQTTEEIRIKRLVQRATTDILSSSENAKYHIEVNFKRLQDMLILERNWPSENQWDFMIPFQSKNQVIKQFQQILNEAVF